MLDPKDIDLEHARIYAELPLLEGSLPAQYRTSSKHPNAVDKAFGRAVYGRHAIRLKAYLPANHSPTGKPLLDRVPYSPELRRLCSEQIEERQRRRKEREIIQEVKPKRGPGRPREHEGHELLASLGGYRRGGRIHFRRDVPLEERARAKYQILDPSWRKALTEGQYIEVERRVLGMRKRANRLRLEWNEEAAYGEAFQEVLGDDGKARSNLVPPLAWMRCSDTPAC